MGAELGYIDSIFNSNNYKYKSMKVNKTVGSRAYPLMKVNKLLIEEKTYKIKTNNFEMLNISGRKNYFDQREKSASLWEKCSSPLEELETVG